MAGYLKTIQIIGNAGRDPEMRFTQSGMAMANFNVAVNDRPRKGQEQQEDLTTWFKVTAFGKQAEIVSELVKKGTSVYVSGDFSAREYTNKEGKQVTSLEVTMREMQILTAKSEGPPALAVVAEDEDDSPLPF